MIVKMEKDGAATKGLSDFSIDHILNKAGVTNSPSGCEDAPRQDLNTYSWLQCTRFCPPKVPRVQKKDPPSKRQLGRYPRIPFTNEQISTLEEKFQESPYLSSEEALNISKKLQLADVKVKIWFQNRRARKRREEMGQHRKEDETREGAASTSTAQSGFEQKVPFFYVSSPNVLEFGHR